MAESQEQWYNRQAIEQLAQHIPFERDSASKAEQIEMLRGLVIRHGRNMDPDLFGFDARNELVRLGLWSRIGPDSGLLPSRNNRAQGEKREGKPGPLQFVLSY